MLHHLVSYFVSETNQAVRPHRWQRSLSLCYSFPAMSGKAFGMHRPLTKGTGLWSGIISPTFCDLATFFLIIASFANLRFCFVRWRMGTFFMVRPLVTFNIFLLARVYVAMTFIFFSCRCGWGGIVEWVLRCLIGNADGGTRSWSNLGNGNVLYLFSLPDCVPFCRSLCIALLVIGDLKRSGVDNGTEYRTICYITYSVYVYSSMNNWEQLRHNKERNIFPCCFS